MAARCSPRRAAVSSSRSRETSVAAWNEADESVTALAAGDPGGGRRSPAVVRVPRRRRHGRAHRGYGRGLPGRGAGAADRRVGILLTPRSGPGRPTLQRAGRSWWSPTMATWTGAGTGAASPRSRPPGRPPPGRESSRAARRRSAVRTRLRRWCSARPSRQEMPGGQGIERERAGQDHPGADRGSAHDVGEVVRGLGHGRDGHRARRQQRGEGQQQPGRAGHAVPGRVDEQAPRRRRPARTRP